MEKYEQKYKHPNNQQNHESSLFYFSTNMDDKNKDREIIAAWRRLSMFNRVEREREKKKKKNWWDTSWCRCENKNKNS